MDLTPTVEKILAKATLADIPNHYTKTPCLNAVSVGSHGYGQVYWKGRTLRAARVVYFSAHPDEDIKDKALLVRHRCHNKACVRLDHLISGTASENKLDSRAVGVGSIQVLTAEDVEDIRGFIALGYTNKQIAEQYQVTKMCIHHIKIGKSWAS